MARLVGVTARGIRGPIIRAGDNIVDIVATSILDACRQHDIQLHDKDIVGITESVVARAQNNYVTVDDVAEETVRKYGENATLLVWRPIFSRNRFSIILRGLARGAKKIVLYLGYIDEVGNVLMDHPFTNVNYQELFVGICREENREVEILHDGNLTHAAEIYPNILLASIREDYTFSRYEHNRIYRLTDFCNVPSPAHGWNEEYGLLGSNKAGETLLKLFPRDCESIAYQVQEQIYRASGKKVEVLVYGDGAFKDPVSGIWELADPVVSPGYTEGLAGTPNEIKLKYIADTALKDADEIAMREYIKAKEKNLVGKMTTQGTTPRRYPDLVGSLCDLVTGSGDKGTPFVLIQGYFDTYASE